MTEYALVGVCPATFCQREIWPRDVRMGSALVLPDGRAVCYACACSLGLCDHPHEGAA